MSGYTYMYRVHIQIYLGKKGSQTSSGSGEIVISAGAAGVGKDGGDLGAGSGGKDGGGAAAGGGGKDGGS